MLKEALDLMRNEKYLYVVQSRNVCKSFCKSKMEEKFKEKLKHEIKLRQYIIDILEKEAQRKK